MCFWSFLLEREKEEERERKKKREKREKREDDDDDDDDEGILRVCVSVCVCVCVILLSEKPKKQTKHCVFVTFVLPLKKKKERKERKKESESREREESLLLNANMRSPRRTTNEETMIHRALEALDVRDDLNARSGGNTTTTTTIQSSRGRGRGEGLDDDDDDESFLVVKTSPNANGGEKNKIRVGKQRQSFLSRVAGAKKSTRNEKKNEKRKEVIEDEDEDEEAEICADAATAAATAASSSSSSWVGISQKVKNQLREVERKFGGGGGGGGGGGVGFGSGGGFGGNGQKVTDKSDRATVEQALDPRTRMILFKMLSREIFSEINGCVSTGKEANVYHAVRVIEVEEEEGEEEEKEDEKRERKEGEDSNSESRDRKDETTTTTTTTTTNEKEEEEEEEKKEKKKNVIQMRQHLAVKVYKTSILVFKDRDRYVSGDWRWRNGYARKNPRKMVKTWAEKEMRNYNRLREKGLRVPKVICLKSHVLVMEMIGDSEGRAAPRLKDAASSLSSKKMRSLFEQLLKDVRTMYQDCKLVHADFSEYNLLYHNGNAWIIDVSQSVDLDHPRCLEFLREDLLHLKQFFSNRAYDVVVPSVKEMFDFVTDPAINGSNIDQCLELLSEKAAKDFKLEIEMKSRLSQGIDSAQIQKDDDLRAEKEIQAAVFHQAHIPKALEEVDYADKDQRRLREASEAKDEKRSEGIYYQTITGMNHDLSGPREMPSLMLLKKEDKAAMKKEAKKKTKKQGLEKEEEEEGEEKVENTTTPGTVKVSQNEKAAARENEHDRASDSTFSSDDDDDDDDDGESASSSEEKKVWVDRTKTPEDIEREKRERKQHKKDVKAAKSQKRAEKIKKKDKKKAIKKGSGKK